MSKKILYQSNVYTKREYLGTRSGSTVTVNVDATFWMDTGAKEAQEFEQKIIDMLTAYEK